jgi:transposase InsO family protein
MPIIDDQMDRLCKAKVFSTIDLKDSYFHVNIDEKSRQYTSFVTPDGQYEFTRAPFGLCTSGTAFCRLVHELLRDLINEGIVIIFVDDIIIPAEDLTQGMQRLQQVVTAAELGGLVINWKKCQFLQTRIDYLGYTVEDGRISFSKERAAKIRDFPEPKNRDDVRRFYHLASYFRKFIPKFAERARPLSELLKKETPFRFEDPEKESFQHLKRSLAEPPVLAIYDPDAETEVHTDASAVAVAGILMQRKRDEALFHPVYYYSRLTLDAEKRYRSFDLECLAAVESIKKFRVYLLGKPFKLVTDCAAFRQALERREINSRVARWALELEEFQYKAEHRPGSRMGHADALSRAPARSLLVQTDARIAGMQQQDEWIRRITSGEQPLPDGVVSDGGILYKQQDGKRLLVVPTQAAQQLIQEIHGQGHFGARKMKVEFEKKYYVPRFEQLARQCLQNCIHCLMVENKTGRGEGFLQPIPKGEGPMETWHIDHLGPLPSTSKRYEYILSVVDGFSKFTWLFPVKRTAVDEALKKLEVLADVFGYPRRIVADRGAAFTSGRFRNFCECNGIELHHITTGVPRGNGQVERVHRVVIAVLSKLSLEDPGKWYQKVPAVQRYLNASFHRAVRASPFKVMFGVEMKINEELQITEVIEDEVRAAHERSLNSIRASARHSIRTIQRENQRNYDKRRRPAVRYQVGDVVFIKKTQFGVGQKLRAKYLGPYTVVEDQGRNRYVVSKVDDSTEGPKRTTTSADLMKPGFTGFEPGDASSSGLVVWDSDSETGDE